MSKQPQLINFSRLRDIFEPHLAQIHEHVFINSELAIIHGDPRVFQLVLSQGPPFAIDDYRLGYIVKGEIVVNVNLVQKHLMAGTIVFIGPGTVITPLHYSSDLCIYGIGLSARFPMPFAAGQMPQAFNGHVRDFQLPATEAELTTVRLIVDALWQLVRQQDYSRPTVSALVGALMHHYDAIYRRQAEFQPVQSREQTIFDRFIFLVNQYSMQERQMSFYAQKMCLTERYLGTVVRQASGVTAKEWIDRSIIMRIQVELRHTDKTVAQISEEFGFPNPSFFSKYFKRVTGVTTGQFRLGAYPVSQLK